MSRQGQDADLPRPATATVVVVAALLAVSACGDSGGTDSPRRTATPTATASPDQGTQTRASGPARTREEVLAFLEGRTIEAEGRAVRIDPQTVVCGGSGRPSGRRHDRPAWTRFRCIQPTFPPGRVVGPDLIFTVQSLPRGFAVTQRHFTSY